MVSCELFREALSARIDGESGPLPAEKVDQHLDACAACRRWYDDSVALRRSMLLRAAPAVPDLTAVILENSPPPPREKWGLRMALGLVALVQCALAFAQLLGMSTGAHGGHLGVLDGHLINEGAAWNLAVGIGLLWAALRTKAAGGQLPLIGGFVLVLTVISVVDVVGDRVTPERLASHGFVVLGLVLLVAVHRAHRADPSPGPVLADAEHTGEPTVTTHGALALLDTAEAAEPDRRSRRRPAGRHRAA
ncbi:zf-HC2 domain-containing protein [Amycolatopsis sp. CA-230715]|uniref:zf-HC2 domain-containing protein n=1 Tax=Amycolatopsis sp. CA-230715 TaxID=2745196 RepID=UPI001C32624D|nr:zf-HC2 domain-containing protein [Amycolatopsis sp. CA-230715]QWF76712.1 hypothetical protein HUW46_00088 [Amycolatopsis sp. CA-230715]